MALEILFSPFAMGECINVNEDIDVKTSVLSWAKIAEQCKSNMENRFLDKATGSIGFCRSIKSGISRTHKLDVELYDKDPISLKGIAQQINDICLEYKKGRALMNTFSNDCNLNLARVRCDKSVDELNRIEESKRKNDQKRQIEDLKNECSTLGFKLGTDKHKECVLELL